jgi:hypothetical protein
MTRRRANYQVNREEMKINEVRSHKENHQDCFLPSPVKIIGPLKDGKMSKKEVDERQGGRNAYQQVKTETQATNIEGLLLRFTKQGDWIAGPVDKEIEIPEGTEMIVGMNVFVRGWQKWEGNKPTESRMGLVSEGYQPSLREDLGDLDKAQWEEIGDPPQRRDPWQETYMCLMLDRKTEQVYTFSTSSKSGRTAIGEVSGAYGDRIQDGEDADEMPIVSLESSSYKHSVYGKIMIPVFRITGKWVKPTPAKKEAAKPAASRKASSEANSRSKPKAALPPPKKPQPRRARSI